MKSAMRHATILIASTSLCFTSNTSSAAPARSAVQIVNETGKTITYEFKWDDESTWDANVIKPGFVDTHSRRYDPNGVLPAHVRFVTANGSGEYRSIKVEWGWEGRAPKYHFVIRNNKVDLIDDNQYKRTRINRRPQTDNRSQRFD
jgi:hypothetical protein